MVSSYLRFNWEFDFSSEIARFELFVLWDKLYEVFKLIDHSLICLPTEVVTINFSHLVVVLVGRFDLSEELFS